MGLTKYWKKRNFSDTPEPEGKVLKKDLKRFVIQEHHATRLHFDFRLEMEGVLRSWAVPKGPSMNPKDKRLAMMVEDHPVSYIDFSGEIAAGNYGAGEVRVWDHGKYRPLEPSNAAKGIRDGKFTFILFGKKLKGEFHMVRTGRENQWLLFKARDEYADESWEMNPILKYGSRSERFKKKASSDGMIERLLKEQSASKRKSATAKPKALRTARTKAPLTKRKADATPASQKPTSRTRSKKVTTRRTKKST